MKIFPYIGWHINLSLNSKRICASFSVIKSSLSITLPIFFSDFVNNITPPAYVPPQEQPHSQPSQFSAHQVAATSPMPPYYGSQVPRNPYFQRFRPSSCEYGWWAPQSSIAPSVYRPRSQKFSNSQCFMYRNFSLNMWFWTTLPLNDIRDIFHQVNCFLNCWDQICVINP